MKLKTTSLLLGLCLAALAVAASPAQARIVPGFGAFHVEVQGTLGSNPYPCIGENFGAVVNNCSYDVSLAFDLPIDNGGNHTIQVQDYWLGSGSSFPFSCQLYSYGNDGSASYNYGGSFAFTGPVQNSGSALTVNVPNGWSLQVVCWNVPPGGGIANLNYNQ